MKIPLFPELKTVLDRTLDDWVRRKGRTERPNARQLAALIRRGARVRRFSHSSLYDWLNGNAKPQQGSIDTLARFFFDSRPEQERFANEVRRATSAQHVVTDPLEILDRVARELVVGVVPFPHFCGDPGDPNDPGAPKTQGFLDSLMRHFLAFSGLQREKEARFRRIKVAEVEQELCGAGTVDMVLGLFAEPSRARTMWLYGDLPIRIPLNAACIRAESRVDDDAVLSLLTDPQKRDELRKKFSLIVGKNELGGIYAEHYLGLRGPSDLVRVDYGINSFVNELARRSESGRGESPLLLGDEVTAAHVVLELLREKRVRDAVFEPRLVAPLANPATTNVAVLPTFRYTFAVARRHTRWVGFLHESFELFLESNTELVTKLYLDLKKALCNEFADHEIIRSAPGEAGLATTTTLVDHWLSLDNSDVIRTRSPAWQTILLHATPKQSADDGRPGHGENRPRRGAPRKRQTASATKS